MNIRWHKWAAAQLLQVEEYVLRNFGEYTRQEFMDEVEQATLLLAEMPIMGKTDPLFVHRKLTYRSFIVRQLNKIVYYVKDDTLHIAAFWDTRREPKNQAVQTDYPISLIPPRDCIRRDILQCAWRLPFLLF